MTVIDDKLGGSLAALRSVSQEGVVRASDLSRVDRERLLKSGFLKEVVKGWLVTAHPDPGSDNARFPSCWGFVSQYLNQRFGDDYCLSAEASLLRHIESETIPRQITVVTISGSNQVVRLPYETSILLYRSAAGLPDPRVHRDGLWLLDLPAALCRVAPSFFRSHPKEAEIALRSIATIGGPIALLRQLLARDASSAAGRLAGAYGFLGEIETRDQIARTMDAAGVGIRVSNPFGRERPILKPCDRISRPHAGRIKWLWSVMREDVIRTFPPPPAVPIDPGKYLSDLDARYASDARNSLLIADGLMPPDPAAGAHRDFWNAPAAPAGDQDRDSLAARGYFGAFQAVRRSVAQILDGAAAADTVERDHPIWYLELFAPLVRAGLLRSVELAGYRDTPVRLAGSRHTPPPAGDVPVCMEALFDCLRNEENPAVRAVLGHFLFLYIHPFSDGNGRVGRFLMNALLAASGYPWVVVRHDRHPGYAQAVEAASIDRNIRPLTDFLREELEVGGGTSTAG